MKRLLAATMLAVTLAAAPALAEWEPDGPIRLWIGFGAGGGTDTQARTLVQELETLKGWRIIPENKAGGGGTVMAAQLKDAPADGQTIGFAINTTFDFATLNSENIALDDFDYITTTAGSQMAALARADSGWTTLEDVAAAAKDGTRIIWADWGEQVAAGAVMVGRALDFEVNNLRERGGRGALNALVAGDANVAWGGGVQRGLVDAGELVILASAEGKPLVQAPDAPLLSNYGLDFTLGFQFMLAGPAGMSDEARDAIASAIAEVLANPDSETRKFIEKQYPPGPLIISGDALRAELEKNLAANRELLEAVRGQ